MRPHGCAQRQQQPDKVRGAHLQNKGPTRIRLQLTCLTNTALTTSRLPDVDMEVVCSKVDVPLLSGRSQQGLSVACRRQDGTSTAARCAGCDLPTADPEIHALNQSRTALLLQGFQKHAAEISALGYGKPRTGPQEACPPMTLLPTHAFKDRTFVQLDQPTTLNMHKDAACSLTPSGKKA